MFPALYHVHNSLDADDLPFWQEMAARYGDPILELGCGTGRVLLQLAQANYHIFGLDHDAAMLRYLVQLQSEKQRLFSQILQGDITAFHLGVRFPLILLPCNTYSTLTSEQRHFALGGIRRHLVSGGVFAVSMPNPLYLKHLPRRSDPEVEDTFLHPMDGEPVQVSSAWRRTAQKVELTWIYDHLLPDGNVNRLTYQITQHIIPYEQITREIRQSGLRITDEFGDFDREPFTEESTFLILIAQTDAEPDSIQ